MFNADETGLIYKCLPDRTHVFKKKLVLVVKTQKID